MSKATYNDYLKCPTLARQDNPHLINDESYRTVSVIEWPVNVPGPAYHSPQAVNETKPIKYYRGREVIVLGGNEQCNLGIDGLFREVKAKISLFATLRLFLFQRVRQKPPFRLNT